MGAVGCLLFTLVGFSSTYRANEIELNISAAASLKEAMIEIVNEYKGINENVSLTINYGGSGSLQSQIEQGAPCDIFISAGEEQMNQLEEQGILVENTRKDLLENSLVLITQKKNNITSINDLSDNKVKHIALGEPKSVPAGKYADEVLTNLNLKNKVNNKLVYAKDVKEVLAWTESNNAEVGFVYYSDAINSDKIKIVENIDSKNHSPIKYPIAVLENSKEIEEAKAFQKFLLSKKGQSIFKEFGYKTIIK